MKKLGVKRLLLSSLPLKRTPLNITPNIWESQIFAENRRSSHEIAENRREPQIGISLMRLGNPNGGLSKRGLGPKAANWAKNRAILVRGNFCSSPVAARCGAIGPHPP